MGCSASVDISPIKWPTRQQCCSKMDEVEVSPAGKMATPRNWTSLTQNIQVHKARLMLEDMNLLVDADFPPKDSSIGLKMMRNGHKKIVWRRPHELSLHPVLVSDGTSRHDMRQGDLNDCWFLSTLSVIAEKPQLISKVIPEDNSFGTPGYNGSFHCRFWQFGLWVDVYVDDLLPTVDGNLLFARSSDPNEYWVSLVEKAYAKLNKSYAALEYGFEADAYTDLTGGLAEWYTPTDLRENDFYLMRAAFQCGAVIGCLSLDLKSSNKESKGMVSNHSYVVTAIEEVPYMDKAAKLIRLRNPWGETEWQGEWSDGSDEWLKVPDVIKRELDVTARNDGEFWMSFNDFKREFCNMIICNMSPDFDHDGISDKAEYQLQLKGCWKAGCNAGGWIECHSFHKNPQYHLHVYNDVLVQRRYTGRLPVVVSLLQVYKRDISRRHEEDDLQAIGFEIFQLPGVPICALGADFFQAVDPLMPENEETYAKYRETSGRFFLHPGDYLLVPSTHEPDKTREFLFRLFSVGKISCTCIGNQEASVKS
ncbi:calpain-8 [Biomphalaria glabrata]|nr:calpain-8 [Biomphalaria glabrata]